MAHGHQRSSRHAGEKRLHPALEVKVVIDLLEGGIVREAVVDLEGAEARVSTESGVVVDAAMSVVIFIRGAVDFGAVCGVFIYPSVKISAAARRRWWRVVFVSLSLSRATRSFRFYLWNVIRL
jgi:hypothetical protein